MVHPPVYGHAPRTLGGRFHGAIAADSLSGGMLGSAAGACSQVPIEDPSRCLGTTHAAPDVEYSLEHEAWAWGRASGIYGLRPAVASAERIQNYTACFPVATNGAVFAGPLRCAPYPNLFLLNGLASGGIAQGPGAGLYLSRIVATALGKPPVPLPEGDSSLLAAAGLASVAFLLVGWVGRLAACCCLRRASPEPTRTAATEEPLLDE